jgi:mannose-6-phosphate isomerase-like protein (cupin superfamily)
VDHVHVLPIAEAPNWAATRFGLDENELELRILRGALACEHIGVSYMRFGPDWSLTVGHRHPPGGEEVYVLVEGSALVKVGDETLRMDAPAAIRLPSETFRAIRAVGGKPAVFVAAGYPIEDPDATEFDRNFWPEDE